MSSDAHPPPRLDSAPSGPARPVVGWGCRSGLFGAAVVLSSCAIFYDFDGGDGGAGGTTSTTSTSAASSKASATAISANAVSSTTATSSSSGWCRDDLCFTGGCVDANTCGEAVFSLLGRGQRVHIDADEPSVATLVYLPGSMVGFAVATNAGLDSSPPLLPADSESEAFGFLSHDADEVVFGNAAGGMRPYYVYERQSFDPKGVASMLDPLPNGAGAIVNGVEPHLDGWVGVAGENVVTFTGNLVFERMTTPLLGSLGHALVRVNPDTFAYSFYGDPGCIGVVVDTGGTWTGGGCPSQPTRPLGLAVAGSEIFYIAQRNSPDIEDIVGVVDVSGSNPRIFAHGPAVSGQFIAVDATTVYFDAGPSGLYACPRSSVEEIDAPVACTRPVQSRVGGLSSARLAPGTPDERWLVCYTLDDTLHCQVTP